MTNKRLQTVLFALLIIALFPAIAYAHLVTTGMGPVYDGIGHLLLTPEDLIPALALALFAGLRGARSGRKVMFLLPVAWFLGGLAGSVTTLSAGSVLPALSFLLLGVLVAVDLSIPAAAVSGIAIALGLVHGGLNGTALREGAGTLGLVGIMAMLFVMVTLVAGFVVSLEKRWARVAVRVAGSWIAATGLLMFGWTLR